MAAGLSREGLYVASRANLAGRAVTRAVGGLVGSGGLAVVCWVVDGEGVKPVLVLARWALVLFGKADIMGSRTAKDVKVVCCNTKTGRSVWACTRTSAVR